MTRNHYTTPSRSQSDERRAHHTAPQKPMMVLGNLQDSISEMRSRLYDFLPELMQTSLNVSAQKNEPCSRSESAQSRPINIAWPVADDNLVDEILQLVQQAAGHRTLKKGANETIKMLERGKSELVVLAADTVPLAIVSLLPRICEDKNTLWIYVPSKEALGRECGCLRPVIACVITTNQESELQGPLASVKEKVERKMV